MADFSFTDWVPSDWLSQDYTFDPGGLTPFTGYDLTGTTDFYDPAYFGGDLGFDTGLDTTGLGSGLFDSQYGWADEIVSGNVGGGTDDWGGSGGGGGGGSLTDSSDPWRRILLAAGGAAPGLLSLIGQLAGGRTQTTTPKLTTNQQALSNQLTNQLGTQLPYTEDMFSAGSELLAQLARMENPLQKQQYSILEALAPTAANLASGDMEIPQSLRDLVASAYEPAAGSIATRAIESARNRGFAGGAELLNTGAGGALAGPALSDLAGHESQSLLNALIAFPKAAAEIAGSYNTPISQLTTIGTANLQPTQANNTALANAITASGTGSTTTYPVNYGTAAGQALAGGAQGWAAGSKTSGEKDSTTSLIETLNSFLKDGTGMSG